MQGPGAAEASADAALMVEGQAMPAAAEEPAAEAPAEAEAEMPEAEEEPPAPSGALELAETAESLQTELAAYTIWRASVRVHKLAAEPLSVGQPSAVLSQVDFQVMPSA